MNQFLVEIQVDEVYNTIVSIRNILNEKEYDLFIQRLKDELNEIKKN